MLCMLFMALAYDYDYAAPGTAIRPLPEDTLVPRPGSGPPTSSGIRISWEPRSAHESLGTAVFAAAAQLGLEREGDSVEGVCVAVGRSPLRAAAWLRARSAAIGHAVRRVRLAGAEANIYQLASQTPVSRKRHQGAVSFGRIDTQAVARWMNHPAERRVAILMVGPSWPTSCGLDMHALVAVHASGHTLTVFDPAAHGALEEIRFELMDRLRNESEVGGEVLLAARRSAD